MGGVLVGLTTAKALTLVTSCPSSPSTTSRPTHSPSRLTDDLRLSVPAAAGLRRAHASFCCDGVGRYRRLGTTIDDALGEAFDKTAKLLGLAIPVGRRSSRPQRSGRPDASTCRVRCSAAPAALFLRRPQDGCAPPGPGRRAALAARRCRSVRRVPNSGRRKRRRSRKAGDGQLRTSACPKHGQAPRRRRRRRSQQAIAVNPRRCCLQGRL